MTKSMRLTLSTLLAGMVASPAFAATGPFFSLRNTDFIVLLAFLLFLGILIYFKVPTLLIGMLDKRADGIKTELEEARALREEAQTLLASYERKQKEAQADMAKSLDRRMAAAKDQISSAEAAAVKEVRDQAVTIAVAAARDVIAKQMTAAQGNKLIDDGIAQVEAKLH